VTYRIAGIDVHKRMLAVVIADVAVNGEYQFQRRKVGTSPSEMCRLADWLVAEQVEEVVMESTAQYWRPVWATLEQRWRPNRLQEGVGARSGQLHLAQAESNRGTAGRKKDFPDAERLVKRLVAQELKLSFVPDGEQRLWRTVMRRKHQLTRNRVQFQNRLECLLEEAHIKLSSLVSDLLGKSARRMLQAIGEGATNPEAIAALADHRLRATAQQLCDADDLRRKVLYPTLHRCGIKRTPRADGFHAFRRATSKYLRKASGLELAAVQLGHKRMTTTDEHYNDRDMDDLKKAAELVEGAFISSFAPDC
jgi:transposase